MERLILRRFTWGLILLANMLAGIAVAAPLRQLAPGTAKKESKTGVEMVFVPRGAFTMGSDRWPEASPAHKVSVKAYWIGKNLVTVSQFRAYCEASNYGYDWKNRQPMWGYQDNFPMVNVTWYEAEAFCKWAGGDLPTEAQWEKAARDSDAREFPWGSDFNPSLLCSSVDKKLAGPMAVGSFPDGKSSYGCLDMSGNAAQWCLDWYASTGYRGIDGKDPIGAATGTEKVLKGGNWFFTSVDFFRSAYRGDMPPTVKFKGIGFRLCRATM